jgi:hypothetical protein
MTPNAPSSVVRPARARTKFGWGRGTLVFMFLAAATLLVHGWSLGDGSVLDDHWHQKSLRELGWSYQDLMQALVIEPSRFIQMWWQVGVARFEYGRPFFIVAMKLIYNVLGGNDPRALHAAAVLLHFVSALLVARICFLWTERRLWALVGGLLFAIYQHAVVTVAWSSSFNIVIATTLMLASILLYFRASRLEVGPAAVALEASPAPASYPLFALATTLWFLALLTRENALMVPVVLVLLEWLHGGQARIVARRGFYLTFAALGVAFVVWRALEVRQGMPELYFRRPDGDLPAYGAWLAAKLLHYVAASVFPAPMVAGPTGRYDPWSSVPEDCLLMIGIIVVTLSISLAASRRIRGAWVWTLWIVLAVLPVVPVIATPHSGYLSGVGYAIGAALAGAGAAHLRFAPARYGVRLAVAGHVALMAAMSLFNRWQWYSTVEGERYGVERVLAARPEAPVTDVFFLNLPLVNIYIKPALVERIGGSFESVRCHALTFSPDPFEIRQRVYVEQTDEYSFNARTESEAWFSRLLGRLMLDGFGGGRRFSTGQEFDCGEFRVRIARADEHGVWELSFRFRRPLSDPRYCFYVFTKNCYATRLRFGLPGSATLPPLPSEPILALEVERAILALERRPAAAELLFAARRSRNPQIAGPAAEALREIVQYVATATAAPVQELLDEDDSDATWERVRAWWRQSVDEETLRTTWGWRERCAEYEELREEVPHARRNMAKLIRTDFYLTGPPFDDPR